MNTMCHRLEVLHPKVNFIKTHTIIYANRIIAYHIRIELGVLLLFSIQEATFSEGLAPMQHK